MQRIGNIASSQKYSKKYIVTWKWYKTELLTMSNRGNDSPGTKDPIHMLTHTPTSITVRWQSAESERGTTSYRVKYRIKSRVLKKKYQVMNTRDKEVTLTELRTNTEYEVKVVWVDKENTEHFVFRDVRATSVCDQYNDIEGGTHLQPTPTTITVKWQKLRRKDVQSYQVKFRYDKEKPFETLETKCQETEITGLKEKTKYEVKVLWVDQNGDSHVMFEDFVTTLGSNEGKTDDKVKLNGTYVIKATSTMLTVDWNVQAFKMKEDITSYQVKYRIANSEENQFFKRKYSETSKVEITGLKPCTSYTVIVLCDYKDGSDVMFTAEATTFGSKSAYLKDSELSHIDTSRKPAIFHMKPVCIQTFGPKQYLNLRICDMFCRYEQHWDTNREKNILLVGATGTGKSTMIDALMNFIAEVSYAEEHRFSIIYKTEEESKRSGDQQTSSITVYRIPKLEGLRLDHKVNIIDTPGFDGTRKDFDKTITDQMEHLFQHHLGHLDAIFVVVPMSTTRLTRGQQHVFTSIFKLFGKDVEKNVFILLTFDDGGDIDVCMKVVTEAGIKFNSKTPYFRFNNANVLTPFNKNEEKEASLWELRTNAFTELFEALEETQRTTVQSSMEVMQNRTRLEIKIEALKETVLLTVKEAINIKEQQRYLELHRKSINENSEFIIDQPYTRSDFSYTGKNSINCQKCRQTCHFNCWVYLDRLIGSCEAFENNECTICGCNKSEHTRDKYKFTSNSEVRTIKNQDMKDVYEESNRQLFDVHTRVVELKIQFERFLNKLNKTLQELQSTMQKLTESALLRPSQNEVENVMRKMIEGMKPESKERALFEQCLECFEKDVELSSVSYDLE